MNKRQKIYEGKAKILYRGTKPFTYIQHFKDEVTAFNNKKRDSFEGKGVLNNILSEFFMSGLNKVGIDNHFIHRINMKEQLIKACEIIPLEVVIRNVAAGSLSRRLGVKEGELFSKPILEFYLKDDNLDDPIVNEEHILEFGWASIQELEEISNLALRTNDFLIGLFFGVGITLVDFKLEFGRPLEKSNCNILLADEITPDSCRLWDIGNSMRLDKDVFRLNLGNLAEVYSEVAHRFNLLPKKMSKKGKVNKNILSLK